MQKTADELAQLLQEHAGNRTQCALILAELKTRRSPKARALAEQAIENPASIDSADKTEVLFPGKYARVHDEAVQLGIATKRGWQWHDAVFQVAGKARRSRNVHDAIWRIVNAAGSEGMTGEALATALRHDQAGNIRSEYCRGLPPIGWAEGWIDTAIDQRILKQIRTSTVPSASSGEAVRRDLPIRQIADVRTEEEDLPDQPIDEAAREQTYADVAALRAKLIDLGRRNPLISFKHSGRSATMLRIVDERPDLLFAAIEGKQGLGFEPLPGENVVPADETTPEFGFALEKARLIDEVYLKAVEPLGDEEGDAEAQEAAERALRSRVRAQLKLPPLDYGKGLDVAALARAHGFDTSYDLKGSDEPLASHHQDDRARVLLTAKQLDKQLKSIWERYRSHSRETGLHTLFLALGYVQWHDEATGDTPHHAPALLLAVELERKVVRSRYEYALRTHEEGLQVNIALAEKMRRHWGLEMPVLREGETPESYFARLAGVIAEGQRLKLRRFATLSVLPFPQMVLWKDLDPASWQESAFADHALLPGLLGAAPMDGSPSPAEPYDIDAPEWADKAPALVRPADASQHSALIEVSAGANLAVEGPPGTGKSETITNMIASAVSEGRTVLFVAEKQAALRVVADRLKATGLGPLVLELHGDTAKRDTFYDALRERLDARVRDNAVQLAARRRDLAARRDQIRQYLHLLDTPVGALGRSAYDLLWQEIGIGDRLDSHARHDLARLVPIDAPAAIDATALATTRAALEVYAKAVAALDGGRTERTAWVAAKSLAVFDQRAQLQAARVAAAAAQDVATAQAPLAATAELLLPEWHGDPAAALEQLYQLERFDVADERVVAAALQEPDTARTLLARQGRWRQLDHRLRQDVAEPMHAGSTDLAELSGVLAQFGIAAGAVPPNGLASAGDVFAQLASCEAACHAEASTRDSRAQLATRMHLSPDLSVATCAAICDTLVALGEEDERAPLLQTSALAEPLAGLIVEEEGARAGAIRQEQAALQQQLHDGATDEEPTELVRLADILEDSGFFARLFGGEFGRARKRAARLLRDSADREAAARTLREVARNRRAGDSFAAESRAQALFPQVLWKGAASDFAGLMRMRELLDRSRQSLAGLGQPRLFDRWLAGTPEQRARVRHLAREAGAYFRTCAEAGLGAVRAGDLADHLAQQRERLGRLARALRAVDALDDGQLLRDNETLPERLQALHGLTAEFETVRRHPAFGWSGPVDQPLDVLARAMAKADALRAIPDPLGIVPALCGSDAPVALMDGIMQAAPAYMAAIGRWRDALTSFADSTGVAPRDLAVDGTDDGLAQWHAVATFLDAMAEDEAGARAAADLFRYRADLDAFGLQELGRAALDGRIDPAELPDLYELALVVALLQDWLQQDGAALARAGGLNLAAARESFVQIDVELHRLEADAILARRLEDEAPWGKDHGAASSYTGKALLDYQLGLRRPSMALRDVVHRAGDALQVLKPVWMMSPSSAAQFIRPGSLAFDLLVIDEASQMRPEFAISALLRAGQAVVVGDANQLPPSDHFQAANVADDDAPDSGVSPDTESILDLANQRFRRKRRLKWHYRSQHESLIQFSNREFYDSDLVVFPSPMGMDDDLLGVRCTYVPALHPDTLYEASINQREAQAVIEEAFRLMRAYPQHSIGIAAMNAKQTQLIEAEFERLILEQPDIRRFVDQYDGTIDEFFIKNLENVQGDERDTILISTVYGPDRNGVVKQNFGLMNREVGWRRLNVLVTRAKMSTRVFTSLRPNDVKVTPTSSRGVRAFNAYLTYIHNAATVDNAAGGEAESPFESFVAGQLREAGFEVVPQVGVEGFRIDLGIRHPDYPLGFLAGIECDGAPYHSGQTVRDRDRIRQLQLQNLGWRIYRVWSVDWYADPARETARMVKWLHDHLSRLTPERPGGDPVSAVAVEAEQPAVNPAPIPDDADLPEGPVGQAMRPLDGIEWYEEEKGRFYTIWSDGEHVGDVTVLSRSQAAARIYDGQIYAPKPEYEGRIRHSGERFKTHDIYAAVRGVAKGAAAG
jgi:very-short-patch-repair endonuclease